MQSRGSLAAKSFTLYLDESGDPGWVPPLGKSRTRFFVAGGGALTPEADNRLHGRLEGIVDKFLGRPPRAPAYELKWSDLDQRRGVYRRLSLPESQQMADEVIGAVLEAEPIVFATAIDKKALQEKYVTPFHPKRLALKGLAQRFDMMLQRVDAYGTIVCDEARFKNDAELRRMIHEARSTGLAIRGMTYNPTHDSRPVRINGTIQFAPSELSAGIQMADAISGIVWMAYEKESTDRLAKIERLCDALGSRRFEPVRFP